MTTGSLRALASLASLPEPVRRAAKLLDRVLEDARRANDVLALGATRLGDFDLLVSEPELGDPTALPFETHVRFADLHCVLSGREGYEVADVSGLVPTAPYEASGDCAFFADGKGPKHALVLEAGCATVFLPGEAHKTKVDLGFAREAVVRKAVVKIPFDAPPSSGDRR